MKYLGMFLILAGVLPGLAITAYSILNTYTAFTDDALAAEAGESAEANLAFALQVITYTVPVAALGVIVLIASRFRRR
ncbi:MAG: hypothetical protein WD294_05290 [Phycisphaeraceae bacterium]